MNRYILNSQGELIRDARSGPCGVSCLFVVNVRYGTTRGEASSGILLDSTSQCFSRVQRHTNGDDNGEKVSMVHSVHQKILCALIRMLGLEILVIIRGTKIFIFADVTGNEPVPKLDRGSSRRCSRIHFLLSCSKKCISATIF